MLEQIVSMFHISFITVTVLYLAGMLPSSLEMLENP
jgi:hypothetical protein